MPIPTYFLGSNSQAQEEIYEKYEINETNNEVCPNLFYLGKRGVYTLAVGFTLAYLSGKEKKEEGGIKQSWEYDKSDILSLRNTCWKNFSNIDEYRGIDFLLTSEWAYGLTEKEEENSSKLISFLSLNIKPRYHFCGTNNKHYEKVPFRMPAFNARSIEPVSRFIALAKVNNAEKSKFLYALSVAPLSTMRLTELMQKSTDEIECPYVAMDFLADVKESQEPQQQQQFFWSQNDGGQGQRNRKDEPQRKRFKPAIEAGEKCWFCLQSPDLEKHLIICVGEYFYLAMAKGPINNFHTLLIPIDHLQSSALLSEDQWQELEIFKRSLKKFFDSMNQTVIFFERNYMTSHSNINAVGIPRDIDWQLSETLKEKAEEFSLQFETIPKLTSGKDLPERGAYFIVEFPNETLITRTMNKFPINFGRDFACAETLLNAEDRIDWRNCKIPKSMEIDIVNAFKEKYKPFDFTASNEDE